MGGKGRSGIRHEWGGGSEGSDPPTGAIPQKTDVSLTHLNFPLEQIEAFSSRMLSPAAATLSTAAMDSAKCLDFRVRRWSDVLRYASSFTGLWHHSWPYSRSNRPSRPTWRNTSRFSTTEKMVSRSWPSLIERRRRPSRFISVRTYFAESVDPFRGSVHAACTRAFLFDVTVTPARSSADQSETSVEKNSFSS